FEILEQIKMQRAEKKLGLVTKISQSGYKSSTKSCGKDNYSNNTGMTKEEIENLVKDIMASSQSQPVSQTISSKSQENQITLSQDEFKKIIAGLKGTITKGQQTLKKPPDQGNKKQMNLL